MATGTEEIESVRERHGMDEWSLDRRLTVLERRFDTILPMLATKADLAELKAELKAEIRVECAKMKADLSKWLAGIVIALFLGFGGMFFTMISLFQR
jgi:hypothetical protein